MLCDIPLFSQTFAHDDLLSVFPSSSGDSTFNDIMYMRYIQHVILPLAETFKHLFKAHIPVYNALKHPSSPVDDVLYVSTFSFTCTFMPTVFGLHFK